MRVIGYGSFLNKESLAKTIVPRPVELILVKGYRRIFNLKASHLRQYKVQDPLKVAVLNVIPDAEAFLNAILFEVNEDEFEKLKIRNKNYYTKEVEVYNFKTNEQNGTAILFIGKKLEHGERVVEDHYLPIPQYLDLCKKGAYDYGESFGDFFMKTTYTTDGKNLEEYS